MNSRDEIFCSLLDRFPFAEVAAQMSTKRKPVSPIELRSRAIRLYRGFGERTGLTISSGRVYVQIIPKGKNMQMALWASRSERSEPWAKVEAPCPL